MSEQHPAYKQGVADYEAGRDCPYSTGGTRAELWSMGWYAAQETRAQDETCSIHDLKAELAEEEEESWNE